MTSPISNDLFNDLRNLVTAAKQRAAGAVNAEITQLYWQVGKRLADEVLGGERGEYGKAVLQQLAAGLTSAFGKGWSVQQLRHCLQFASVFTDPEKVSAVRRQLSWTHNRQSTNTIPRTCFHG